MIWAWLVTTHGRDKIAYIFFVGKPVGEKPLTDGRITLEGILGKSSGKVWIGCIWLSIETLVGLL
jgi:hypothetical protein